MNRGVWVLMTAGPAEAEADAGPSETAGRAGGMGDEMALDELVFKHQLKVSGMPLLGL